MRRPLSRARTPAGAPPPPWSRTRRALETRARATMAPRMWAVRLCVAFAAVASVGASHGVRPRARGAGGGVQRRQANTRCDGGNAPTVQCLGKDVWDIPSLTNPNTQILYVENTRVRFRRGGRLSARGRCTGLQGSAATRVVAWCPRVPWQHLRACPQCGRAWAYLHGACPLPPPHPCPPRMVCFAALCACEWPHAALRGACRVAPHDQVSTIGSTALGTMPPPPSAPSKFNPLPDLSLKIPFRPNTRLHTVSITESMLTGLASSAVFCNAPNLQRVDLSSNRITYAKSCA